MKNYLLVLAVMIAASPAFASRARLEALGESKNGSMYIDDSRNMFFNPAAINNYKKKLFVEMGTTTETVDTTANASSKAQGGFTNTFGDFVYGLYLGNESDRTHNSIADVNAAYTETFLTPENTIDFFFGGDTGSAKWGFNLFHSGKLDRNVVGAAGPGSVVNKTFNQWGTRLGAMFGQTQVFSTVALVTNAKGSGAAIDEFKGKLGVDLGATHTMDNMTYFAKGSMTGFDYSNSVTTGATTTAEKVLESDKMTVELGFGYKKDVSKSANLFTRLQAGYSSIGNKQLLTSTTTVLETKTNVFNIPLTVGMEAEALSWLTLRAAIHQTLWGQSVVAGARDTINNSTNASFGLGLKFGDIMIDGLLATNGGANNDVIGNGYSNTATNTDVGFGDAMISRVGLTYSF